MMLRALSFLIKSQPKISIRTDKIQTHIKGKQDAKIKVEQRLLGKYRPQAPKIIQEEKGNKGEHKHYSKGQNEKGWGKRNQ